MEKSSGGREARSAGAKEPRIFRRAGNTPKVCNQIELGPTGTAILAKLNVATK